MKLLRHRIALIPFVCFIGSAILWSSESLAFKQSYHEKMSEALLKERGFDRPSADEVGDSNWQTDLHEQFDKAAHADDNLLDLASARLLAKKTLIVEALQQCDKRTALDELGAAFHTVQDILSHSNSIDNDLPIHDLFALKNGRGFVCDTANNFAPDGLVSGYFSLSGALSFNQCRGLPDGMCCHRDLNKDSPTQPNGARHEAAYAAAESASLEYLNAIYDDIRSHAGSPSEAEQLIKLLKKRMRRAIFVIDDSGSMSEEIAYVKQYLGSKISEMKANPDESNKLGLISFDDAILNSGFSCNLDSILAAVNRLKASGGGSDCGEVSNQALLKALNTFPRGRGDMNLRGGSIILATDEPASNPRLGWQVATKARDRGIAIHSIVTADSDCTPAGSTQAMSMQLSDANDGDSVSNDATTPDTNRKSHSKKLNASRLAMMSPTSVGGRDLLSSLNSYEQYGAISAATGGLFIGVHASQVDEAIVLTRELEDEGRALIIERTIANRAADTFNQDILVDDTVNGKLQLLFATPKMTALPEVTLINPSGQRVTVRDDGVELKDLGTVKLINITSPQLGQWQVEVVGQLDAALQVFGYTTLQVQDVRLSEKLGSENVRHAAFPIMGAPVSGTALNARFGLSNPITEAEVRLINLQGEILASKAGIVGEDGITVSSDFIVPKSAFLIQIKGETSAGDAFSRVALSNTQPETFRILLLDNEVANFNTRTWFLGEQHTLRLEVLNNAEEEKTFNVFVADLPGITLHFSNSLTLAAKEKQVLEIIATVPAWAAHDVTHHAQIWIQDATDTARRNGVFVDATIKPPIYITGDENNNELQGFYNDNIMKGLAANDALFGKKGNDQLFGGEGDDELYGGEGDDSLSGESGNDQLNGGAGNDTYTYYAAEGHDTIVDSEGEDSIVFHGIAADGVLLRRQGSSLIITMANGNSVHIVRHFSYQANKVSTQAVESIRFDDGTVWNYEQTKLKAIQGYDGNDVIDGHAEDDLIDGGLGDDQIEGRNGSDILRGGEGNDTITDYSNDQNQLFGGNGDDELIGRGTLHGDAGNDRVMGMGNLYGDDGNDQLKADGPSLVDGGSGDDTLEGSSGDDQLFGREGDDTLYADTSVRDGGDNELAGGPDNDTLYGGYGKDTYYFNRGDGTDLLVETRKEEAFNNLEPSFDRLVFGEGVKSAETQFFRYDNNLVITFAQAGDQITIPEWFLNFSNNVDKDYFKVNSFEFKDSVLSDADVENRVIYVGTEANDRLNGYRDRSETIRGEAGNDVLDGQAGNDFLLGGEGNDRYFYLPGQGVDKIQESSGTDLLVLRGGVSAYSETIKYLKHNDDLVIRFDQNEEKTVRIVNHFLGGGWVVENLGHNERATSETSFEFDVVSVSSLSSRLLDYDTGEPIDPDAPEPGDGEILGTVNDDQLQGTNADDVVNGLAGNDVIFTFGGADVLKGGDGNDYLNGGDGDDTLRGEDGADTLLGAAGNDLLIGGAGDDSYHYDMNQGQDIVNDQNGGTDILIIRGGMAHTDEQVELLKDGDDLVIRLNHDTNQQIRIKDQFLNGDNMIEWLGHSEQSDGGGGFSYSRSQVFSLGSLIQPYYEGTPPTPDPEPEPGTGEDTIIGTDNGEQLVGTLADEVINGLKGDDVIFGLGGKDIVKGGGGNDQLYGGYGSGQGSGNDWLLGGAGSDQLNGEDGNDRLSGGLGDDRYLYTSGLDTIKDQGNGSDSIFITGAHRFSDLSYQREGDDLLITINDDASQVIRVEAQFSGNADLIEMIYVTESGDMSSFTGASLSQLTQHL